MRRFTEAELKKLGIEVIGLPEAKNKVKKPKNDIQKMKEEAKKQSFMELVKKETGLDVVAEYRFHDKRKWRFDFAILEQQIAIEVEGGVWTGGRHTRGNGFLKDAEKYNEASIMGWILIRTTPKELLSEKTIELIKKALRHDTI